jgi:hypothetical protein
MTRRHSGGDASFPFYHCAIVMGNTLSPIAIAPDGHAQQPGGLFGRIAQEKRRSSRAARSSGSRKGGAAIAISARARSARSRPCSAATPCSVTT